MSPSYSPSDTIVALATPPGRGGLAVVRLSGSQAVRACRALIDGEAALEPRRATLVRIAAGSVRDEAVVTWFCAPASYTGEDVVEIALHGSAVLAASVIAAAMAAGARVARAGEFTLRAFLNGKLDLSQAEAVNDLASATTGEQARMAFDQLQGTLSGRIAAIERQLFELAARLEASIDFPEEGFHFVEPGEVTATLSAIVAEVGALLAAGKRGRVLREGATVALVGRTNVGKSTIFNRLVGSERAIVTDVPGTTRDLLSETVSIDGVPATFVDTAGARATEDPVEREGVTRARKARESADLLLVILDGSAALADDDRSLLADTAHRPRLVVVNKTDLPAAWTRATPRSPDGSVQEAWLEASSTTGTGIEELIRSIARNIAGGDVRLESPVVSNVRHLELLQRAHDKLLAAIGDLTKYGQIPEELILSRLGETRAVLEELTGKRTSEDLLNEIFSKFCVGK